MSPRPRCNQAARPRRSLHSHPKKYRAHRAAEYTLGFHMLAAKSGWNEPVLKAVFHWVLNHNILMKMSQPNDKASLDSLIDLAIRLDNLLLKGPHSRLIHILRSGTHAAQGLPAYTC